MYLIWKQLGSKVYPPFLTCKGLVCGRARVCTSYHTSWRCAATIYTVCEHLYARVCTQNMLHLPKYQSSTQYTLQWCALDAALSHLKPNMASLQFKKLLEFLSLISKGQTTEKKFNCNTTYLNKLIEHAPEKVHWPVLQAWLDLHATMPNTGTPK